MLLKAEYSEIERPVSALQRAERLLATRAPIALFLDFDGTLVDVALTPESVSVPPELSAILSDISHRLSGALAIVTGRRISEADRLLRPLRFTAAGVHGAEMRLAPEGAIEPQALSFDPALKAEIKRTVEALPGVVMEDKGGGIALHYRLAPEFEQPLRHTLELLKPQYPGQFKICGGRKVYELLPIGFSKGNALNKLAALHTFKDRLPLMIGDDVADVGAFRAAEHLGGVGLKVAGENFSEDEAAFRGPTEVRAWLKALARVL